MECRAIFIKTQAMEYLTTNETCIKLKITRKTLETWCNEGRLPKYKIGGRVLYKLSEVDNLINSCRV